MFVKVCGLRTAEQIDRAVSLGYDAIGVVLHPGSKRYCEPALARTLAAQARGRVETFAVGLTYAEVSAVADAFDVLQIYEARDLPNLAFSSSEPPPLGLDYRYYVYDASLGRGTFGEPPAWLPEVSGRVVVAGGLDPVSVGRVIETVRPYGVDVSSGVERDGVKDPTLMAAFLEAVRAAAEAAER